MADERALPHEYVALSAGELVRRTADRKRELGDALCILGHHYQCDEVVQFADFVGDSLKLSQAAAAQRRAAHIVFCGVHFMAESADILTRPDQAVCLPNILAGCAMADMADDAAVATALEEIAAMAGGAKVVPITYVNSSAATKAVTARAGGACCTSSNVANVFRWALEIRNPQSAIGNKLFAIPDRHLGLNTALALGYKEDDCVVYDPRQAGGGLSEADVRRATFILWNGQCYVHQLFRPEDVTAARERDPQVKVIVHPECPREVVRLADASGSTEQIITAVTAGAPGSHWAVGTEANLVRRLAQRLPDRTVRVLADRPAHCVQMARITLGHLLWVLDNLAEGRVINRVTVPEAIAADARVALQRMIDIRAVAGATNVRRT
ncbi:MAG: quinolinate synthase NadA [Phycisphaerae bacterium]